MFNTTICNVLLTAVVSITCEAAFAAEDQTWFVAIVDDTAILSTNPNTEIKFVASTLDELQRTGIKKVTLSPDAPPKLLANARCAYSISVVDGLAQIRVTNDLPKKYVESARKALGTAGIDFVNVSKSGQ